MQQMNGLAAHAAWQGRVDSTLSTSVVVLHARLQAAGLHQPHPNPLWRFATMALTAQLAAYSAGSLPAGSAERLAAMVAFCQSRMQAAADSRAEGDALEDRHLQMLAYKALVPTMLALSTLPEVLMHLAPSGNTACWCPVTWLNAGHVTAEWKARAHLHAICASLHASLEACPRAAHLTPSWVRIKAYVRMQRSPTIAASWLEALSTLITHVVRDGKPVNGDWSSLHGVSMLCACSSGCLHGAICMRIACILQQHDSMQLT